MSGNVSTAVYPWFCSKKISLCHKKIQIIKNRNFFLFIIFYFGEVVKQDQCISVIHR